MLPRSKRWFTSEPPHLFIEAAYWRCPVQVFTGLSWLLVGLLVGVAAGVLLY